MRQRRYYIGALSDAGQHRARNEDAFALPATRGHRAAGDRAYRYPLTREAAAKGALFLVADGVGGSEAGQAASLTAVRAVVAAYYASRVSRRDLALEQAAIQANEALYAAAARSGHTGSTTLVGLLLLPERSLVLNIGDSRAYRLRNGAIEQLTQDHSLREELLHSGDVAPEDGVTVPEHIITRSVGRAPTVTPDIFEIVPEPGDQFLLCTDGLTRHVTEEELRAICAKPHSPQRAVEELAALANARGGKDNITVMLIRFRRGRSDRLGYTALRWLAALILLIALLWAIRQTLVPRAPAFLPYGDSNSQKVAPLEITKGVLPNPWYSPDSTNSS